MAKPRKDAVLLNLPEERQDQVAAWLRTAEKRNAEGDVIAPGGLELARQQLAADGIKVSYSQLSRFWAWYQLDRRYASMRRTADQLCEMAAAKGVPLEKARELAQGMFTLQAIETNNSETYIALEQLDLSRKDSVTRAGFKREEIDLKRKKFQRDTCRLFVEWSEDAKARAVLAGAGSNAEKIERLGQAMFGEDW